MSYICQRSVSNLFILFLDTLNVFSSAQSTSLCSCFLLYHVLRYVVDVHGTRDPGLVQHRKLLAQYCEEGTTRLMEWDGDHRVPIKTKDVLALVRNIWDVAFETGLMTKADIDKSFEKTIQEMGIREI